MLLRELLEGVSGVKVAGKIDVEVSDIAYDSRLVKQGTLFICLSGTKTDGHQYIKEAIERGAAAIVVSNNMKSDVSSTIITSPEPRQVLSKLADKYFSHPSRSLRLIGVTGTNGKTTTTHLIDSLLRGRHSRDTGLIGTISYKVGSEKLPVQATTPEALVVHKILREMVDKGINYCTVEVSSHALALNRVDDCDFNVAVLTNITEDHLDFHKSFSAYLKAKAKLFRTLTRKKGNFAVINNDDPSASLITECTTADIVTYGIENRADVQGKNIHIDPAGVSFTVNSGLERFAVKMKITGLFSVYNALAAISVALKEEVPTDIIIEVLEGVEGIPGRLEKVDLGQQYTVIVDYAHTPDGLENVLSTVRQFCPGKLIVVFGCGGERDRSKRPLMSSIVLKYSDYALITNDNPRGEPVKIILQDVLRGVDKDLHKGKYEVELDREQAIKKAVYSAKEEDIVVVAGKGHETYQVFADKTIEFDDRKVARYYIRERMGR